MAKITIKRTTDGVRYAQPYLGTDRITGKAIRPYREFPEAQSDDEALRLATEWISRDYAAAAKLDVSPAISSVLAQYIDTMDATKWSAQTAPSYRSKLSTICQMGFGDIRARDFSPADATSLYTELLRRGQCRATVRKMHHFLSGAFKWMASMGIVDANPIDSAEPPRLVREEAIAFTHDQAVLIMTELRKLEQGVDDKLANFALAAHIALSTGMRLGEVCALRWCDITFGTRMIHVGHTAIAVKGKPVCIGEAKTHHAVRNITAGSELVDALLKHRARQCGRVGYMASGDYVICLNKGSVTRPTIVTRWFTSFRQSLGINSGSFHTLRHTHATMLIAEGVDIRTVQERMGHADVATTLRIYAHVMPGRDSQAADAFGAAMQLETKED